MEPGRGGQEKRLCGSTAGSRRRSQWSLAVAARKSAAHPHGDFVGVLSQWSLAVAARKSRLRTRRDPTGEYWSQWSLAVAARKRTDSTGTCTIKVSRRNGAWPWRPGKEVGESADRVPPGRRNGAWPWRPGKAPSPVSTSPSQRRRNGAWPWRPGKEEARETIG